MTRHNLPHLILFIALLGSADLSYGQICVTSDPQQNTACGTTALSLHEGNDNTAMGYATLLSNSFGDGNTATGYEGLLTNASGNNNTASGYQALRSNQSGSNNTATGSNALFFNDTSNTGVSGNTADGADAMNNNTSGTSNTAVGYQAMQGAGCPGTCGTGSNNTAIGATALANYSVGSSNTASGQNALFSNTSGGFNTATGSAALFTNVTGSNNTADGEGAMYGATGSNNTAVGQNSLKGSVTGSGNVAFGFEAGINVTTGSNNIEIGNKGVASDAKVIKIGTEGSQTKTFIAGIYNNTAVSGLAVVIGSNGELGTVASSERFKTAIAPMGSNTDKLQQLRPVTFRYKTDTKDTLRYGLIAEEVAKVYPELVVRNDKGRIDGVRYDELAPMLLNEMQQQHAQLTQKIDSQAARIASLEQQLAGIQAALTNLQPKEQLVAQR